MSGKIGILLVNLGTPLAPTRKKVRQYLLEFLTDNRVIDLPWAWRQLLVRGLIIPRRYRESTRNYEKVWRPEGSPLMIYGHAVVERLQYTLGEEYQVELAMRYQQPSIADGLEALHDCREIVILPLFPQYASATTGSVHQKVMESIKGWNTIPSLTFVNSYPEAPKMIAAFCDLAQQQQPTRYDYLLLSFHGLPERQIKKADTHGVCLSSSSCCQKRDSRNASCYSAQCHATAAAIACGLNLEEGRYGICFQSRLGNDPWLRPYTSDVLKKLANDGYRNVLVLCPAFACDCVETIHEISVEYQEEFATLCGGKLSLVPGLNDHPLWIEALEEIVKAHVSTTPTATANR